MEENRRALIKIEYENSIPAKDLANYFTSLNNEFKAFVKANKYNDIISDELEIKEIRQGSIEIYPFVEYVAAALPIFDQTQIFIDFINGVVTFLNLLKKDDSNIDWSQKKLANYSGINGVNISGDNNKVNYMVVSVNNPDDVKKIATITNAESKIIEKNIRKHLKNTKTVEETSKKATMFYWDSAKFDLSKPSNYKGICKEISNETYNVTFANDEIEHFMTGESHLGKSWQYLNYIVDIEMLNGKKKPYYKITKVYKNQTFYESDDDE